MFVVATTEEVVLLGLDPATALIDEGAEEEDDEEAAAATAANTETGCCETKEATADTTGGLVTTA